MKILVCSDLHGDVNAAKIVWDLFQKENPDKVVMCGDIFEGFSGNHSVEMSVIFSKMAGKLYSVKGNNDSFDDAECAPFSFVDDLVMPFGKRQLFFTHGHRYNATHVPPILKEGDVLVYGHTHAGDLFEENGLFVLNVGSLWLPRCPCKKNYGLIDDDGITLKLLDGAEIAHLPF